MPGNAVPAGFQCLRAASASRVIFAVLGFVIIAQKPTTRPPFGPPICPVVPTHDVQVIYH